MKNLVSSISQFAQIRLTPVDVDGQRVTLDSDAIVAEVLEGEGARASVEVINDEGGRRFLVNLIPGNTPGKSRFKVKGDGQPGEGEAILEEEFEYTTTPNNAINLGAEAVFLSKSTLPTA